MVGSVEERQEGKKGEKKRHGRSKKLTKERISKKKKVVVKERYEYQWITDGKRISIW